MQSADSILNAGSGSFIVTNGTGELRQNGVGPGGRDDVLFPIGPSTTIYAPVTVGSSVSGAVDDYAFRVCADVRTDGSCSGGSPVNAFGVDLTWVLGNNANLTTLGLTYDLTFEWPASVHLSGFDPASVAVNYFDPVTDWTLPAGETYTNAGGTGPYSDDAFGLDQPPGTSFGMSSSGVLLAIDFLSFNAHPQPEGVQLDWQVMEDPQAMAYRIERSRDGHHWETIHTTAANGVAGEHHYQWIDTDPHRGDNYYRIAGINADGSYELSAIRQITWEQGQPALTAFPNPSSGAIQLQWTPNLEGSVVTLHNALGQVVSHLHLHPNQRTLTLPAGVYFLNETISNTTLKIVVYE